MTKIDVRFIDFDGSCPFLFCLEHGPHRHAVCPSCEAVRFGNLNCELCKAVREHVQQWIRTIKILRDEETEEESMPDTTK